MVKGNFVEQSKVAAGMDMFLLTKSSRYGYRIRRYAWDKTDQRHYKAEFIKPNGMVIQRQLFELRMNELAKQQKRTKKC